MGRRFAAALPDDFQSWRPPPRPSPPPSRRPARPPRPPWGHLGDSQLEEVARQAAERRAARFAARATLLGRLRLSSPRRPRALEMWLALGRSQRMLALGAALVLVAAAAILVLPWLKVQRVEVEGSPAVPRPELLQQAGVRIGQSSLLVDTAAMTRDLLAQPWVGSAQVRVSWPSTLVLVVEPLPPALEYQRDGVRLPLAGNGALLGSAASGVIGGLPLLVDQRPGAGGRAGEVVVPPRLARALAALATVFPKTYGVSVERFLLDRVGALEVQSGAGWTADLGLALTQGQIAGLGPKLEALRALAARVDLKAPGIREIYLEDPAQVTVSP